MALTDARAETRLPAQDLDRARRWYADKLGLEPAEERPGGLRYECASGVFWLFTSGGASEGTFTQLALNVADIEAEVAELRRRASGSRSTTIPASPRSTASWRWRATTRARAPGSAGGSSATARTT